MMFGFGLTIPEAATRVAAGSHSEKEFFLITELSLFLTTENDEPLVTEGGKDV